MAASRLPKRERENPEFKSKDSNLWPRDREIMSVFSDGRELFQISKEIQISSHSKPAIFVGTSFRINKSLKVKDPNTRRKWAMYKKAIRWRKLLKQPINIWREVQFHSKRNISPNSYILRFNSPLFVDSNLTVKAYLPSNYPKELRYIYRSLFWIILKMGCHCYRMV